MLVALVAGVWLAHYALHDSDYVVVGFGEWVVQTSLTVFAALLVLAFVPTYWAVRFLSALWRSTVFLSLCLIWFWV
jgi:HemY protein